MHPNVSCGDAPTVRLDAHNEVQPDAILRLAAAAGGQSVISEDDYIEGAPELVVEIAASSAAIDLHSKKEVYRRNGVPEYIVLAGFRAAPRLVLPGKWQLFTVRARR
jgi:Uma2 family endonuclease